MGVRQSKKEDKISEIRSLNKDICGRIVREDKYFNCVHRTTGIEFYYECCDIWTSCGSCHIMGGCDNRQMKLMRIRCITCRDEFSEVYGDTCRVCGVIWGTNPCKKCNLVIKEGENYRHCDKCDSCVWIRFTHCDRCNSCFCRKRKGNCYWSDTCSICLESTSGYELLIHGRIELYECGHNFHWDCFKEHINKGNTRCPVCRQIYNLYKAEKRIPDTYEKPVIKTIERITVIDDYDFCD